MHGKKIWLTVLCVILAVGVIAGASALASPGYGTQDDPLVTLSYINETVIPQISSDTEKAAETAKTEASEQFAGQIDELKDSFDDKASSTQAASTTDVYSVVSLKSGQTVTCAPGTELILRVGSASSTGSSSPRLIDVTDGSSVSGSGTSLTKNHLYMVTINGNGIKATSAAKVLIRGNYTVS